jgi:hypothetical protein
MYRPIASHTLLSLDLGLRRLQWRREPSQDLDEFKEGWDSKQALPV